MSDENPKPLPFLTEDEKRIVLDDAFTSEGIDVTIRKLSTITTRREFNEYLKRDLDFAEQYRQCLVESCMFLENDMLSVNKRCKGDYKLARVMLDQLVKVLQFRNPERYGNKLDVKVETVSLKFNLENANKRVQEIIAAEYRPAILKNPEPVALIPEKKKPGRPKKTNS